MRAFEILIYIFAFLIGCVAIVLVVCTAFQYFSDIHSIAVSLRTIASPPQ